MKTTSFRILALILAPFVFGAYAAADLPPLLEKDAKREEIRHSMVGPRDTLLFYTFADQAAVLKLRINNTDPSLPVSGKLYLFKAKTNAQDLAKWINNQHSDGIFPEVPEPTASFELPDDKCKVTHKELLGEKQEEPQGRTYQDFKVTISVARYRLADKFDLAAFEDEAGVFVEVTAK